MRFVQVDPRDVWKTDDGILIQELNSLVYAVHRNWVVLGRDLSFYLYDTHSQTSTLLKECSGYSGMQPDFLFSGGSGELIFWGFGGYYSLCLKSLTVTESSYMDTMGTLYNAPSPCTACIVSIRRTRVCYDWGVR